MGDVKRFTDKSDNCYSITPEQLVRDLLADLEAGRIVADRVHILVVTKNEDRTENLDGFRSRMDRIEEIGYLTIYHHMRLEAMKR